MSRNEAEVLKGTTTIGIVCSDGVVLASERRASMGRLIASKRARKIHQIDDSTALTMAGSVGDAQRLVRIIKAESNLYRLRREEPMSVKGTATILANVIAGQMFPPIVQLIVGGADGTGGHIYSLDPGGGMLEEKMLSTGSGSPVAYGVLEDSYEESVDVEEGRDVAVRALTSAMARDSASGDGYDVAIIREGEFEFVQEEVEA
ncbi:MAG: Proteasome subunit beta [Methanonatronarchaeales archaeon]|nr:Proteasome subunit beta [Methanonatronarchaeales archaeon]